ncbi:hypothetical protein [Synechococcus sp. Cu2B8-bc1011]|uniref:hypothetical protein n=1 Tax=Synechococcus sp. Cu2B8-bc1011 TaxID=3093725 RepID=UPI0039AEFD88
MEDGEDIRLLGKGNKPRIIRVSFATLELFESLGRTGAAVPAPPMRSEEVSVSSRFKQSSDRVHLGRQVMTLLLSLATVLLCGWVNAQFCRK